MELYYFKTMNPRKACATAKYLKSPVTFVELDPRRGEHTLPAHLKRNPNGRVPVLVDGDHHLWESAAIMAYLAVKAGSDLWPASDPSRQVEVLRWISWDICEFARHAGAFYFENQIKPALLGAKADPAALAAATPGFHKAAGILENHLHGRDFVVGDSLTVADFCIGVLLPDAERIGLPLADYPSIRRWHDGLMRIDAWRDPWPS